MANKKNFILLKKIKIGIDKTKEIKNKKRNKMPCSSKVKEPAINRVNKPTNKVNALIIHCTNFC
jgi:hypothetical protein